MCQSCLKDGPMTPVQLFTYLRHRYPGLEAYFFRDRDLVVIPLAGEAAEVADDIRETAISKGLICSEVSAAWPELVGPEIAGMGEATDFLVIAEITGKYLQPG